MPNGEYISLSDHLEYASLGAGCDCPHGPGQCPWGRTFLIVPDDNDKIIKYNELYAEGSAERGYTPVNDREVNEEDKLIQFDEISHLNRNSLQISSRNIYVERPGIQRFISIVFAENEEPCKVLVSIRPHGAENEIVFQV